MFYGLSIHQVFGMFFLGYITFTFLVDGLFAFFEFLSWGFHFLLAKLAGYLEEKASAHNREGGDSDHV